MPARTLPPFPINDETLTQLEHALDTSVHVDEDGTRTTVGGDCTLPQLLDFYSGADPSRATHIGYAGDCPVYEAWDQHYSEHDVIRALIQRIRELETIPTSS